MLAFSFSNPPGAIEISAITSSNSKAGCSWYCASWPPICCGDCATFMSSCWYCIFAWSSGKRSRVSSTRSQRPSVTLRRKSSISRWMRFIFSSATFASYFALASA